MIVLGMSMGSELPRRGGVTVLVADDNSLFRRAAGEVVEATEGFRLVAEAASGEEAVRLAASLRPQLVLMDMRMPGLSGAAAARRIAVVRPDTVVVLLSAETGGGSPDLGAAAVAAALEKRELNPRTLTAMWTAHAPDAEAVREEGSSPARGHAGRV
jgi:DNA-binding NarL/FixJ family response regulator